MVTYNQYKINGLLINTVFELYKAKCKCKGRNKKKHEICVKKRQEM